VLFVPRYATLQDASTLRQDDVARLATQSASFDDAEREAALSALESRLEAVIHWEAEFEEQLGAPGLTPDQRLTLSDVHHRLTIEATTLRIQVEMLAPNRLAKTQAVSEDGSDVDATAAQDIAAPPKRQRTKDRVVFGQDLIIRADEKVRDAVVFGGNITIEGWVTHDAVAFGGDVTIQPEGRVAGDAVAFGGTVHRHDDGTTDAHEEDTAAPTPATPPSPPSAAAVALAPALPATSGLIAMLVRFLTLTGAGVLTLGLVPDRVSRVSEQIAARPVGSIFIGFFGGTVLALMSLLFAVTIVGLPISALLVASLGFAWLLGFMGLSQALGDRLGLETKEHGRWLVFLGLATAFTVLSTWSWTLWLSTATLGLLGIGGALTSRFGQR
jgi:hypothetical protein